MRWSDRLQVMSVVGGGALGLGSLLRIRVDRSRFRVAVTEFDPPARMVTGAKNLLMSYSHCYEIAPVSKATTALTLTGSMGGPVGLLLGAISRRRMSRDLGDELDPIKEAAESPMG